MAIMAGEAIVEGSESGMAKASAKRRARRTPRTPNRRFERDQYGYGRVLVEEPDEPYEPSGGGGGGGRQRGGGRGRDYASQYGSQARYVARNAQITPGKSSHQGAILAEFVVCIIIVTLLPIATGGSADNPGPSPYGVHDLKRMVGIGVAFFLLALVPGEQGSRIAAWLGFLVMLVLLINAFNSGELSTVLGIFSAGGGTEPPGATQPTGP